MSENRSINDLLKILEDRFQSNMNRHEGLEWDVISKKIIENPKKLESLILMENSGGEPDCVGFEEHSGTYLFFDCSAESPGGRRSCCYDQEALDKRKENKPKNSAENSAQEIGMEILSEEQYRYLQTLGKFDAKTSSWLKTPEKIRKLGGAIFADFRFETIFVYHNGAESYYAGRGFRGVLKV